jgi:hypothetical protein
MLVVGAGVAEFRCVGSSGTEDKVVIRADDAPVPSEPLAGKPTILLLAHCAASRGGSRDH